MAILKSAASCCLKWVLPIVMLHILAAGLFIYRIRSGVGVYLDTAVHDSWHSPGTGAEGLSVFNFTLLTTNDMHSSFLETTGSLLDPIFPTLTGKRYGGYARLAHLLREQRKLRESIGDSVLLLDAGDFSSGDVLGLMGKDPRSIASPELEYFSMLEYDAITFGNHDFDEGDEALALRMRKFAKRQAESTTLKPVTIVASNIGYRTKASGIHAFEGTEGGVVIQPYLSRSYETPAGPKRVCIFGAAGPDASFVCAHSRTDVHFDGYNEETMKLEPSALAARLREQVSAAEIGGKCDAKILLYHGGGDEEEGLTSALKGSIDIVVAGHTHEAYIHEKNSVLLQQCGACGLLFGVFSFGVLPNGTVVRREPSECAHVVPGKGAADIAAAIKTWEADYERLDERGWGVEKVLYNKTDKEGELLTSFMSHVALTRRVSSIIADQLNEHLAKLGEAPIDVYMNSPELVAANLKSINGRIILSYNDIGRTVPNSGRKEIGHLYLPKSFLSVCINYAAAMRLTVSPLMILASNEDLSWEEYSFGIPFINRIHNLTLRGKPYEDWPELIHVAGSEVTMNFFWRAGQDSYGLLDVPLLDKNGKPLPTFESSVIHNINELRLITDYLFQRNLA